MKTDGEFAGHQEANLTMTQSFKISKSENLTDAVAVINGYDIGMKCAGEDCNSNGIWPFLFNIEVKKVDGEDESDY